MLPFLGALVWIIGSSEGCKDSLTPKINSINITLSNGTNWESRDFSSCAGILKGLKLAKWNPPPSDGLVLRGIGYLAKWTDGGIAPIEQYNISMPHAVVLNVCTSDREANPEKAFVI
ncbi:hypothetical protein EJ08DRAFT_660501 [Tothia fuscella]|uniref:Uncharacterized protein n=1 Tax=Tothia fuscella TaxID=1048955 RepID=A0A9P4TZE7_9PEZI|nr:hypothetical protein EJ08DRAFT_660501 [Tothia fuscella]